MVLKKAQISDDSFDKDEFIYQLMTDRDRLFRENSRLRSAATIESETGKEDYKEQLNQKEELLEKKEVRIAQLEKQVAYLNRMLHGEKAERYINPNPDARQLDIFEGIDLLPGEKEVAIQAEKEINTEKERRAKRMEKEKSNPTHKTLPENLERKKEQRMTRIAQKKHWNKSSYFYEVERQIKDQGLSFEEAAELRKRLVYPIMVRFEKWLVAEYPKVVKESPIEKRYFLYL